MHLYLLLEISAILIPLSLSFEKHLKFYKRWKYVLPAILWSAIPFIVWDIWFTKAGYWGFNPKYLTGFYIFNLPLEEVLFFLVVPYASLFGYYSIVHHFPRYRVSNKMGVFIASMLLFGAIVLVMPYTDRIYTLIDSVFFFALLALAVYKQKQTLRYFLPIFPILLVPFFLMNGILTGTAIADEVVWYNSRAIIGLRIGSIPVEDIMYAFSMILLPILLTEFMRKKFSK